MPAGVSKFLTNSAGPRVSITARGGPMRTTTSPAAALKVSAPAKTNPINRLKTITPLLFSAPNCQPSSSPSEGVIENQQAHRADNRHEETIEVESAYARGSKDVEQPATGKSADNTHQDVEQDRSEEHTS